ncbi:MAG: hypothetical protein ACTSRA_14285, partial [Promethearchaeota archaeon]
TAIIYLFGWIYIKLIFIPMEVSFGTLIALIPFMALFLFIIPFFVYFPLTVVFGAWDQGSLDILRKATKISGPGKLFTVPMFKLISSLSRISPLHGIFSVDDSAALKEARELMQIKNKNREKKIRIA